MSVWKFQNYSILNNSNYKNMPKKRGGSCKRSEQELEKEFCWWARIPMMLRHQKIIIKKGSPSSIKAKKKNKQIAIIKYEPLSIHLFPSFPLPLFPSFPFFLDGRIKKKINEERNWNWNWNWNWKLNCLRYIKKKFYCFVCI